MNRLLIVAYYFSPPASTGALRIGKLAEYLPEFGWEPVFLTTSRYGVFPSDKAAHVYRAGDLVHAVFRPLRRAKLARPEEELRTALVSNSSWLGRLRDRVMVPDTKLGWLFPAVHLGRRLIEQYRPAAILSTSPPETAHLVACQLSRGSKLPWVADFRDGWLFEPPQPQLREGWARRALEGRLESQVVQTASALTGISGPILDDLSERYRVQCKVCLIPNGFDGSEYAGVARRRGHDGLFLLVYTGALGASQHRRSTGALFAALSQFYRKHPATPLRLKFVGNIGIEEQQPVHELGLSDVVTFAPPVSRQEVRQVLADADAALLITAPGQRSVATSKLYDYIGAGIPIFALAEDNAAAATIQQYGLGITVPPSDPAAIERGLEELMSGRAQAGSRAGLAEAQRRFEWHALTKEMAQLLEHLQSERKPK